VITTSSEGTAPNASSPSGRASARGATPPATPAYQFDRGAAPSSTGITSAETGIGAAWADTDANAAKPRNVETSTRIAPSIKSRQGHFIGVQLTGVDRGR